MAERHHLKPVRIRTHGLDGAEPMSSNETARGRSLNRRKEIHISWDIGKAVKFS
ncbi:MAG TPA: hypothetical protein VMW89_13810 [Desulfatiglandales bacterium]|nr:hypothetical protein [Desulfatiglandales bacterium]